ncbi:MAG: transporter substrate-binding domain-containing protein [Ruminococcaceae bacterium]|nr:transporter substrate-binding domain-containing protein [Oscillospiraceae bacterium]
MKKILALVLAAAAILAIFAGCSAGKDEKKESKLVVGITDYEPMDFKDENGDWTGFDAELVEAVAEKLGYTDVEFVEINWDKRFFELESGSIDVVWNGMTITDEVKKNCDVSKAYATNSQVVVMSKDALAKYPDAESIKAANLTIAVEKGSAGEDEAKKLTSNIVSLTAQSDAIKDVKGKASDACVIDSTMANSLTADGKSFDDLGYTVALTTEEYGAGFKKGSELTEKVNTALDELKKDGTLQKLSEKYGVNLAD